MNNPIVIFSLDSIIECWFDYCFLKNYTFHKLTSEFCFFLFFFWESSAGEFWSSNPNKLLHVRQFAASNQCNRPRPDLLENTTVKLRSVYVRWLVDFDPRPLSVSHSFFAFAVCLFQLLFWLKAMKNAIVNGRKKEANTIEHNRQE